jgi:uncharacterized protein YkuJ
MSNGFKDKDGKFHPVTTSKGVRKSRSQKAKKQGVKIIPYRKQRVVMTLDLEGMSQAEKHEWEDTVGSEIVKVKKEMMNGRPVTSVRFANGEEWFEFDQINHQEEFLMKENIKVDDSVIGEFVEVDHPDISGYITMATGKVLFGEREDRRKREPENKKIIDKLREKEGVSGKVERLEDEDDPDEFEDRVIVKVTKKKTFDSIGNGGTALEIIMRATGLTENEIDQTLVTNGISELEDEGKIKVVKGKWVKV